MSEIMAVQQAEGTRNLPAVVTPMDLIQRASAQGASIEQMAQLFDLKLRVEADEAKKAFNEAFTAFKAEDIRIVRDKENTQYSKAAKDGLPARKAMYTSLENMVAVVTPYLSRHGLAHSWDTSVAGGMVTVACVLTHVLGHSRMVSIPGPLDESGAKNKLQQIKSSMTYLKVATFESVCGLASALGNLDDDGNGAGKPMEESKAPAPIRTISKRDYEGFIAAAKATGFTSEQIAGEVKRRGFEMASMIPASELADVMLWARGDA